MSQVSLWTGEPKLVIVVRLSAWRPACIHWTELRSRTH